MTKAFIQRYRNTYKALFDSLAPDVQEQILLNPSGPPAADLAFEALHLVQPQHSEAAVTFALLDQSLLESCHSALPGILQTKSWNPCDW